MEVNSNKIKIKDLLELKGNNDLCKSGISTGRCDNASTFSVDSGMIKVNGNTAHLFYEGPVNDHRFKNFEFKADVMTRPHSNSGIYFHTAFQQGGWPQVGYDVQVNNSHTDWRRTGSLYGIEDVKEVVAPDNVWFTEYIKVTGNRVVIKLMIKQLWIIRSQLMCRRLIKKGQLIQPALLHCRAAMPAALFILKILW